MWYFSISRLIDPEVVVQIPGDVRADLLRANALDSWETCRVCLR